MRRLARDPAPLVVCSHRPVLPTLLKAAADALGADADAWDPKLPPGGFLVLHREFTPDGGARLIAAERHQVSE